VVARQAPLQTPTPGESVWKIEDSRVKTEDILKLLATALNTNWPADTKLAIDNWGGQIFVTDKSGKPIFNVSSGINVGDTNVVYFSFGSSGSIAEGRSDGNDMKLKYYKKVCFHLFCEQNGIPSIDWSFDGIDVSDSSEDSQLLLTTHDEASVTGSGSEIDNTTYPWVINNPAPVIITGVVKGSGRVHLVPIPF
jgi:hypothetical protein